MVDYKRPSAAVLFSCVCERRMVNGSYCNIEKIALPNRNVSDNGSPSYEKVSS